MQLSWCRRNGLGEKDSVGDNILLRTPGPSQTTERNNIAAFGVAAQETSQRGAREVVMLAQSYIIIDRTLVGGGASAVSRHQGMRPKDFAKNPSRQILYYHRIEQQIS